ncbi:MAG: STAS domain-containing protein [Betaproteobacteria bacterium]|nr:STAS domain-containing protein [Betaproteobacteria bacterium]
MIRSSGNRVEVAGDMTLSSAAMLLEEGGKALEHPATVFDLAAVTDVDSSSIAVIFGWLREAQRREKTLSIVNPPEDLLSLAAVYDVSELLPFA